MSLFTFNIRLGQVTGPNNLRWNAFSGHGEGYDNPAAVDQKGVGPLPPGLYACGALEPSHASLGSFVMSLSRLDLGSSYGRGSFYIHGAAAVHPELSSDGCIILQRGCRRLMDQIMTKAGDRQLRVIAGLEPLVTLT